MDALKLNNYFVIRYLMYCSLLRIQFTASIQTKPSH